MGACMSSSGGPEVSEAEKQRHRVAEQEMKEAKIKLAKQVKVLLLGSGDSGKSTVLKQMRLIHHVPFTHAEIESYRQLVFNNLTHGLKYLLDAMFEDMKLEVSKENQQYLALLEGASDLKDGEAFPISFYEPLRALWDDPNVQIGLSRGNEVAIPENMTYFFSSMDRLFDPKYVPIEQDILQARARTIGITETLFSLKDKEMLMVDVGGQKSERRKWIHCFQDVTSILFLASLSAYDQCLVEDRDASQMQDSMAVWESICGSPWFKNTSIILFLNKSDLFNEKVEHTDVSKYFPDYSGEPNNAKDGRDYFKQRFAALAQKTAVSREVFIHITVATDSALLKVVMVTVENMIFRINMSVAGFV